MHKGFYIKILKVIGKDQKDAGLVFDKGLNVIEGASDTGKSYIFQLIDYMFGGSKKPKNIGEARNYTEIRMQINTYDNKKYTFSRQFDDNNVYYAETDISDFDSKQTKKLRAKKDPRDDNNISCFLLGLTGLEGKKLKINARNVTREISFRDVATLCLIDESDIISEISPIYTNNLMDKTVEESLFKLMISGRDDDGLEAYEDPKIFKSKINGRLELIDEMLREKEKLITEINKQTRDLDFDELNLKIEEFTNAMNMSHNLVQEKEVERENIWKEIEALRSQLKQNEELSFRFKLLDKHYKSDLSRLDFINEGNQVINQIKQINCPTCGTLIKSGQIAGYKEINEKEFNISLTAESKNIQLKQKELEETMNQMNVEAGILNISLSEKMKQFESIDQYIANKLKPNININNSRILELLNKKTLISKLDVLKVEINNLAKEKKYYGDKLKEKQKKEPSAQLENNLSDKFVSEVEKLLREWHVVFKKVEFDKTTYDINIDNKPRKDHGKGLRAIYRSAFLIALMKYCILNDKAHPFLMVLDSPLTAYKKHDTTKEDEYDEDIQNYFYDSLSKISKDSSLQIIILENIEPSQVIKKRITFEHFSGNKISGRYGFYPLE